MATVKQIIEKAYTRVNGEYQAIVESDDDFSTYLNFLNQAIEGLVDTPHVKWQIFFDMNFTLPTPVVNNTLSYSIPGFSGLKIANSVYDHIFFLDGSGNVVTKYKLVDVAKFQATSNTQIAAIAGDKLYLKATESKIVGTTIRIPVYKTPAPYTSAIEVVTIDSVPWLVHTMAAMACDASPVPFIARNADKFYKQAEGYMKTMKENNRRSQLMIQETLGGSAPTTWQQVMNSNSLTMKDL